MKEPFSYRLQGLGSGIVPAYGAWPPLAGKWYGYLILVDRLDSVSMLPVNIQTTSRVTVLPHRYRYMYTCNMFRRISLICLNC